MPFITKWPKSGGFFLSATHFEACGETSNVLAATKNQLSFEDYEKLSTQEDLIAKKLAPIIRDHIGLGIK